MNKRETHIVTGMTKDLAISRFEPSYVYDARNIRIRTVGNNNTMLSVTNEKGTAEFTLENGSDPIVGTILGTASFSDTLVIFTKDETYERIYKLVFNEDYTSALSTRLYQGTGLNLQYDHPLETLALFENESIKKVYWVDGVNQPRVINISKTYADTEADKFNFNREIGADAKIKVTKFNSGGEFRPGTVQYCFNYFDKFGQETNIVDVSPLYYVSPKDSGLAADATSNCSFQIDFSGLNIDFEYIRVYAIYRSSENATPNVRVVGDFKLTDTPLLENFEKVVRPVQQFNVDVPFSELWVIDSSHNLLYNVSERYSPGMSSSEYTIPLEENEYLYDRRTDTAYCIYNLERNGYIGPPKKADIKVTCYGGVPTFYIVNEVDAIEHRRLVSSKFSFVTTIVDNGIVGWSLDAEALLFIGGQYIIAGTIADKDNTLFLGNLRSVVTNIGTITVDDTEIKELVKDTVEPCIFDYYGKELSAFEATEDPEDKVSGTEFYQYPINNNRSSYDIKSFKAREGYRLGIIAQYKTGQWSEVLWTGDADETFAPGTNIFYYSTTPEYPIWGPSYHKPGFKVELPVTVCNALLEKGFIKVAPVVVYPNTSDRKVLYQGVVSSTVYNVEDRADNSPYAQPDWRFRMGYGWENIKDEIQCNSGLRQSYLPKVTEMTTSDQISPEDFVKYFKTEYYRDSNILDFYSPDIDKDDLWVSEDVKDLKFRVVGITNAGFSNSSYAVGLPDSILGSYIDVSSPGFNACASVKNSPKRKSYDDSLLLSLYQDETFIETKSSVWRESEGVYRNWDIFYPDKWDNNAPYFWVNPKNIEGTSMYQWYTYIWHRAGSLNGQPEVSGEGVSYGASRTALYNKKCISEYQFGVTTFFQGDSLNSYSPFSVDVPIDGISYCDSTNMGFTQLANTEIFYYGNVDKVLTANLVNLPDISVDNNEYYDSFGYLMSWQYGLQGYPIGFETYKNTANPLANPAPPYMPNYILSYRYYYNSHNDTDWEEWPGFFGNDPIRIKYSTTNHLIFRLSSSQDNTISTFGMFGSTDQAVLKAFWKNNDEVSIQRVPVLTDYSSFGLFHGLENGLFIGEFYRDFSNERENTRFGGNSDSALSNNTWVRCGEAVPLKYNTITVYYREGDTYVGRYDCLKAFPTTDKDQNQFVSIYSTELESRVNLDERYDRLRGKNDNTLASPINFNLFNHEGYEQTNQYFTYKTIDYSRYIYHTEGNLDMQEFPNMITWSLEKTLGEDVDKWTSIPLTSTLDLDGTKGEITKLVRFSNDIYAFQDKAFAQILFNSRVQIPVSDGVPVEITNGYKVDGKRYISEHIGMQNKWSLGVTPYSMYFVDDNKNSIFSYNGQLADLSTIKGMKSWSYMDYTKRKSSWTPYLSSISGYKNLRTFYDNIYNEVYFTTDTESLVYSETLGNFTSFLDYGKLPYLGNMGNKFLALTDGETRLHELWAGDYNKFFGEKKGYSLTFVANADPTMDKVFNNLEWRSTSYNGATYLSHNTFDTLKVWHEHQDTGDVALNDTVGLPTSLKKKFNAFRAFVPRDKTYKMNRIRNPWTYIKLSKEHPDKEKMIFTDLNVDFFE